MTVICAVSGGGDVLDTRGRVAVGGGLLATRLNLVKGPGLQVQDARDIDKGKRDLRVLAVGKSSSKNKKKKTNRPQKQLTKLLRRTCQTDDEGESQHEGSN